MWEIICLLIRLKLNKNNNRVSLSIIYIFWLNILGLSSLGDINFGIFSMVNKLNMFELIILFNVRLFLFFKIFVMLVVNLGKFVLNVMMVKLIIKLEILK